MATVEAVNTKPSFVLTLTWDEAVGLATLLHTGTWASLDEVLGIEDVQGRLVTVLSNNGGALMGTFEEDSRLDVSALR